LELSQNPTIRLDAEEEEDSEPKLFDNQDQECLGSEHSVNLSNEIKSQEKDLVDEVTVAKVNTEEVKVAVIEEKQVAVEN